MLSIFNFLRKQKNEAIDIELSTNPAILYNKKVSIYTLSLFGIMLNDNHSKINRSEIVTTSMEPPQSHMKSSRSLFKNNKRYYLVDGIEIEYLLSDRIESVIEYDGWLHMKTGAKYRIKNRKIVEFALHGDILTYYKEIEKRSIKNKFGKADKVFKHFEEGERTLFSTDFVYFKRRIRIHYQDWEQKINSINIGDSLIDYKDYPHKYWE